MKKILIADDQLENRELMKVTLEMGNYHILLAENGQQTLEIARSEHPNVILLDVKMPGSYLSGLAVCSHLKTDPATADIYIIMISAQGQKREVAAGMAAGADEYLVKPFSPQTLLDKIQSL